MLNTAEHTPRTFLAVHEAGAWLACNTSQKWVYWWASNYASPGLNVLGRRSPDPPAPAQAGTRGAIIIKALRLKTWPPPAAAPRARSENALTDIDGFSLEALFFYGSVRVKTVNGKPLLAKDGAGIDTLVDPVHNAPRTRVSLVMMADQKGELPRCFGRSEGWLLMKM